MGMEIERKFLVCGISWKQEAKGIPYRQGYISSGSGRTVRVRIAGDKGFLTIKGPTAGLSRAEYEYPIPLADATELLESLCDKPLIEKLRYRVPWDGCIWEIDEFLGVNDGLVVAEIELADEQQLFSRPPWLGAEVSGDLRYCNASLVRLPFSRWGK